MAVPPGSQNEWVLDVAWNPVDPSFLATVTSYSGVIYWKVVVGSAQVHPQPVSLQCELAVTFPLLRASSAQ